MTIYFITGASSGDFSPDFTDFFPPLLSDVSSTSIAGINFSSYVLGSMS